MANVRSGLSLTPAKKWEGCREKWFLLLKALTHYKVMFSFSVEDDKEVWLWEGSWKLSNMTVIILAIHGGTSDNNEVPDSTTVVKQLLTNNRILRIMNTDVRRRRKMCISSSCSGWLKEINCKLTIILHSLALNFTSWFWAQNWKASTVLVSTNKSKNCVSQIKKKNKFGMQ